VGGSVPPRLDRARRTEAALAAHGLPTTTHTHTHTYVHRHTLGSLRVGRPSYERSCMLISEKRGRGLHVCMLCVSLSVTLSESIPMCTWARAASYRRRIRHLERPPSSDRPRVVSTRRARCSGAMGLWTYATEGTAILVQFAQHPMCAPHPHGPRQPTSKSTQGQAPVRASLSLSLCTALCVGYGPTGPVCPGYWLGVALSLSVCLSLWLSV
jgi:hypothetical protein